MAVLDRDGGTCRPAASSARRKALVRVGSATRTVSCGITTSRNPFAIWAVLPLITLTFAGLAFAIVVLGLLLIPAVTLTGSLNLTHDGVLLGAWR